MAIVTIIIIIIIIINDILNHWCYSQLIKNEEIVFWNNGIRWHCQQLLWWLYDSCYYKYMKVYQRQLLFVCGINNHVLFSICPI